MKKQDYDKAIEKFNEMIDKYPKGSRLRYARAQLKQIEKLKKEMKDGEIKKEEKTKDK